MSDTNTLTEQYKSEIEKGFLIRQTEQFLLELYNKGKFNGTVHTCLGQELNGVFVSKYLEENDYVVSNHRGHGHFIARTDNVEGLIAEVMGKKTGCCQGIGGSQHLFGKNYISNGIQGGMTPIASGIALSYKLRQQANIAVAYIGDGTLGEGILYESLNIASIWNLPVLFILENNQYAQSTSIKQTLGGNIQQRIEGFGVQYHKTNSWEIDHLDKTIKTAIATCRNQEPVFVEIETYRLNPHSKGDDNRSKEEIQNYRERDILNQVISQIPQAVEAIQAKNQDRLNAALILAEEAELLAHYANEATHKNLPCTFEKWVNNAESKRINEQIYDALKQQFTQEPNTVLIGEDIEWTNEHTKGQYGGAFKVTKDLSELFKGKVRNTPISEAAITGIGTGLALVGMRAIVEIMFGDFTTLIFDQLFQHASKFNKMSGGVLNVPLLIRTPMGGRRGYGPTHSQSIEKIFFGIPDLSVIALNHRIKPNTIFEQIFKQQQPCFLIENKVLYTRTISHFDMVGFEAEESNEAFPTFKISPEGQIADWTVVCYGGVLEEVEKTIEQLFDEAEILIEVICPTLLSPLNIYPILESVQKTKRLLVVEEGSAIGGLGSIISAALQQEGIVLKRFRQMANNTIIPCSLTAELSLLPTATSIFEVIKNA